MFALFLALLCPLYVSNVVGYPEPIDNSLVVYLHAGTGVAAQPLAVMKQELSALMQPAGFHVEWRNLGTQQEETGTLMVVDLRGACQPPALSNSEALSASVSLASSSVVDGQVIPFSWIDCSALSRFLGPSLAKASPARRNYIYGRAMARLLAHECYHVVARTEAHTTAGIAKPTFAVTDLLADRFEFEAIALSRLRQPPPASREHIAIASKRSVATTME